MTFNFLKKTALFVICSLLLCGCTGKTERSYEDRTFCGVCGENLSLYSASDVYIDSLNRPEVCIFNDYVYIAVSDGKTYDTVSAPELFSDDGSEQLPRPDGITDKNAYNTYRTGDMIGSLTLREAWVGYNVFIDSGEYFDRAAAVFDGEITLKGYITSGETAENGLAFMPADGEWNGLPVLYMNSGGVLRDSNGFVIEGRAPRFDLGLMTDYDIDMSMVPADGSAAFVEVTLKEITLHSGEYAVANTAEIVSIRTV